ncbi:MAG: cytosine permease, partial [Marinobacter sp.]|nr:cytosine permease [Marinobacter sp.]
WLIPFLVLLGTFIPPIGGVIMASYFIGYKRQYPALGTVDLPAFNVPGLAAYAIGSAAAYTSPWIAPIVGVVVAAASYAVVLFVSAAVRERRAQVLGVAA